ncbi:2-oxo acid dehydrogenase subunit E2, partial [Vibrio sp. 1249-1]
VIRNGQAVAVKAMPLSITFDHRACTGGEAARFTKVLAEHLQRPSVTKS